MSLSPAWHLDLPERFPTREVRIGSVAIGGSNPVLIQSMTISDTTDTDRVVEEIRRLVDVGCPLVRVTAPSVRDAENLREIRRRLRQDGIRVPMVADIHFTPNAALIAARIVEKVRINPGNYADRKKFKVFDISDDEYRIELERIRERFRPLVLELKEHGAALRIGTNHGSLSDRIMNRHGDTPEGMVESALEFARICRDERFHDIVFSMKSSIPSVMIAAYRLLVRRMAEESMDYPIHVGVTEAGNGLEGRIKSAVGIGSLLASGIGDTIRVSLTEDAEHEIPPAAAIRDAVASEVRAAGRAESPASANEDLHCLQLPVDAVSVRRPTPLVQLGGLRIGGDEPVRVGLTARADRLSEDLGDLLERHGDDEGPEFLRLVADSKRDAGTRADTTRPVTRETLDEVLRETGRFVSARSGLGTELPLILAFEVPTSPETMGELPAGIDALELEATPSVFESRREWVRRVVQADVPLIWRVGPERTPDEIAELCGAAREAGLPAVGLQVAPGPGWIARVRRLADSIPGAVWFPIEAPAAGALPAVRAGAVLCDGIGNALTLVPGGHPWPAGGAEFTEDPLLSAFTLLQACRLRLTRAEFIACPSCGRTQFDLQSTTARVRARTGHLKGVKIAIMGCIVNGPGEMADADFGYVGSGRQKVDLYVGKERVARNLHESEAEERLVALIREHGRWVDRG